MNIRPCADPVVRVSLASLLKTILESQDFVYHCKVNGFKNAGFLNFGMKILLWSRAKCSTILFGASHTRIFLTTASQELGLPRSTLNVALDLLYKAGYIRVLPRYGGGKLRQKHVKIYPIDHALIPFGLRMQNGGPTRYALETKVVNFFAESIDSKLFYFRKKERKETYEIDLVVENSTKLKNCTWTFW